MQKLDSKTASILYDWTKGKYPTTEDQEELIARELKINKIPTKNGFQINNNNCQQLIEARSQLFCSVYSDIFKWCSQNKIKDEETIFALLWNLWLPMAVNIVEMRERLRRVPIQGILGGQGTGKSTLASVLRLLLSHLGYSTANISLDDLYKTHTEREKLRQSDPRLIWRGPPGTHDIDLGLKILEQCLQKNSQEPISIPRFDKSAYNGSGDRCKPELIENVDVIIFEGWFVGIRPIEDSVFQNCPYPITTEEDIKFARDNNDRLKEYVPLWEKLDHLVVLYPEDFKLSKKWRKEAEEKMIALGKTGMNDRQIDEFVNYFWKSLHPELFITPLINNCDLVDLVIEIDANHNFTQIYKPTSNELILSQP